MADNTSQFTEIVEIKVQTSTFSESLKAIEREYDAFMSRLSAKGVDGNQLLGTSGFAMFTDVLRSFKQELGSFKDTLSEIFNLTAEESKEAANDVASDYERQAKAAEEAADRVEAAEKKKQAAVKETANSRQKESPNLTPEQNQQYQSYLLQGRSDVRRQSLLDSLNNPKSRRNLSSDEIGNFKQQLQAEGADVNKIAQEMEAAINRPQSALQRFFGALTGVDFAEAFGNVARFAIEWTVVGAAIQAVISIAMFIPNAFKEGWQYLTKFEQTTNQLRGSLMESVKFSDDLQKNYKLAGEAAEILGHKIEFAAPTLGVKPEVVQKGFQAAVSAGANKLTGNDLDKAFGLTVSLMAAEKLNTGVLNARKVVSDIQNTLAGTLTKQNSITMGLRVSYDWMNKQVQAAKEHGDLQDRLASKVAAVSQFIKDGGESMDSLSTATEVFKNQIEGSVAQPMWDAWKSSLKEIGQFFLSNQVQIRAVAESVGTLILRVVELLGAVAGVHLGWQGVAAVVVALMEDASALIDSFVRGVNILDAIAGLMDRIRKATLDGNWSDAKKAASDYYAYVKAQDAEWKKNKAAGDARIKAVLSGQGPGYISGNAGKNQGDLPRQTDPAKNKPGDLMSDFNKEKEDITSFYSEFRRATTEAMQERKISIAGGTQSILQSLDSEKIAVGVLVDKYKTLGQSKLQGEPLHKYNNALDNQKTKLEAANDNQASKAREAKAKDDFATIKALTQIQQQDDKEVMQQKLQQLQQLKQEGLISAEQVARGEIAAQEQAHQQKLEMLRIEVQEARANHKDLAEANTKMADETSIWQSKQPYRDKQVQIAQGQDQLDKLKANVTTAEAQQTAADERLKEAEAGGLYGADKVDLQEKTAAAHKKVAQAILEEAEANLALLRAQQQVNGGYIDPQKLAAAEAAVKSAFHNVSVAGDDVTSDRSKKNDPQLMQITGFGTIEESFANLTNSTKSVNGIFNDLVNASTKLYNSFKSGDFGGIASQIGGFLSKPQSGWGDLIGKVPGLGGLGDALGSGALGGIGSLFSLGGSIVSTITGLFTAQAEHIGKTIANEMKQTMDKYAAGTQTMFTTLVQLQQERNQAVKELSGKKGGQKQLDQLLPQFDQQIAAFQKQQQDISNSFNDQLFVTSQYGQVGQQAAQTWIGIMQQVKQYRDALGPDASAAKIDQFLNNEVNMQIKDTQDQLNSAQQTAIQDAINYNDLLKQRNQLETDYKNQVFEILSSDSIQRRQAGALSDAQKIRDLKYQHDQQLDNLNAEIQQTQVKVDLERQVFNLAQSTSDLRIQAVTLETQMLQEQVQTWVSMQTYLNSLRGLSANNGAAGFFGPDFSGYGLGALPGFGAGGAPMINEIGAGYFNNGPAQGTVSPNVNNNFNITIHTSPTIDARKLGTDLYNELNFQLQTRGQLPSS